MALGQGGHVVLLKTGEPLTHGIAVYGIGSSQLAQRQSTTVAKHDLSPAALARVLPHGGGALQLVNLRDGQGNRCEFHNLKLLPTILIRAVCIIKLLLKQVLRIIMPYH